MPRDIYSGSAKFFSNPGTKPGCSYERRLPYENQKGLDESVSDLQMQEFMLGLPLK